MAAHCKLPAAGELSQKSAEFGYGVWFNFDGRLYAPRSSKLYVYFEDQLCADSHWSCVLRISYVRLSLLVYFEDQLSADCHWWRILRIIYMATLHFEQNAFWPKTTVVCE